MIGAQMDISLRVIVLVGHYVLYPIREYLPIISSTKQKIGGIIVSSTLYGSLLAMFEIDKIGHEITSPVQNPEGRYCLFQCQWSGPRNLP